MDNAATKPVLKSVVESMLPYFSEEYANPSSAYSFSKNAKNAVLKARQSAAKLIGANADEIFFTSGGSEADNWALKGAADFWKRKRNKIVTTKIEHHAILNTVNYIGKYGFDVEYIPVDGYGVVDIEKAKKIIDSNTAIVSVMTANNEVGTIEPIKEIAQIAKKNGAYFHTDAVQAAGHINIDVSDQYIDMLSVSGHKFGAPKGIGFLYKKNDIKISNLIHGGGQEKGLRAGTENVPYIVGLGKACDEALNVNSKRLCDMRDYFILNVLKSIPQSVLNGHPSKRLPSNINISFYGVNGKTMVSMLSMYGVFVSSQSACASQSSEFSYVLKAMGMDIKRAQGAVRFSISENLNYDDLKYTINCLKNVVGNLRNIN